jgi:hypothetical protein
MRFSHVNSYAASPAEVLEMLTTPEFREQVCTSQHALQHSVEVTGTAAGGTTVVVSQDQSTEGAPPAARKVVGDSVRIVQREVWGPPDADPVTAEFGMEIPGKPGQLKGRITLVATANGCEERFEGDVKVGIPLVGGKLEKFIADLLGRGLRREGRVGATWLAERAG